MDLILDVGNPLKIFRARAADHPMYVVAFLEEEFSQVRPVLAGYAGDQRPPFH
jgi:hypothetical protein